ARPPPGPWRPAPPAGRPAPARAFAPRSGTETACRRSRTGRRRTVSGGGLLEGVAHVHALGRLGLVRPTDRPAVRRVLEHLLIGLGLAGDREHGFAERVQR